MKNITPDVAIKLLDRCPLAMLLVGTDHSICGCNAAFSALTGVRDETLESDLQQGLLGPLLGEGSVVNWVMPDGEERWLSIESVVLDDSGVTARYYLDVTQTHRLRKERDALATEVSELSLTDDRITSLLNRNGILVSMAPLVARSRRYNSPLSVVTMSIDSEADRDVIHHRLSLLLKDQTRWADLVGCNEQGNFILVLQEASHDSALQLVEKLDTKLSRMNENTEVPAQASYGIAVCKKNDDASSLLERAEAALVEAQASKDHTQVAL